MSLSLRRGVIRCFERPWRASNMSGSGQMYTSEQPLPDVDKDQRETGQQAVGARVVINQDGIKALVDEVVKKGVGPLLAVAGVTCRRRRE